MSPNWTQSFIGVIFAFRVDLMIHLRARTEGCSHFERGGVLKSIGHDHRCQVYKFKPLLSIIRSSSETSWSEGGGEMLWARTMMWEHLATRWDSDKLLPSSPCTAPRSLPTWWRWVMVMMVMMVTMVIMLLNLNLMSASNLECRNMLAGYLQQCRWSFSFKVYLSCMSFKLWALSLILNVRIICLIELPKLLFEKILVEEWGRGEVGDWGWGCRTLIRLRLTLKCPASPANRAPLNTSTH